MPRKSPLPKREIDICKRLREYRKASAFSQETFARAAGVEMSVLSMYENHRAPVRYDVARSIASVFGMNESWLADGTGAMFIMVDPFPKRPEGIPPGMAFSQAYDVYLKPLLRERSNFLKEVDALLSGKRGPKTMGTYERLRKTFVSEMAEEIRRAKPTSLKYYYQGWKVLSENVRLKERQDQHSKLSRQ